MNGLTETIARFVAETGIAQAPAGAVGKSKKVLTDTFAVMLAGAGSEVAPPLLQYVARAGATGACPILGTGVRTNAELAAMVNGTFAHALDFDDVLVMMPGHPSAIVLAVALAASSRQDISGPQLLEAHLIGIEAGAKIGLGITIGHYNRGFHGTGTLGLFSGVAALAKLYHLDAPTIRTAIGIASSMASGVRRNFGTMTKPLHSGWAARSALAAVELASCGFSAAPDVLEAKSGFFAAYGVDESSAQVAAESLGRTWAIDEPGIGLKKYPCYNGSQRAMDGVLQLRHKMGFTAENVERLECRMPPGGMHVLIYPQPVTGLEGKFSLQYVLAAGVLDGEYGLGTFTDAAVNRPAIRALMQKIVAVEDERCGNNDPLMKTRAAGARGFVEVEVRTTDGRNEVATVHAAPGHPTRPLSWQDIEHKFMDCAGHAAVDKARAQRALQMLSRLEDCISVNAIVQALTP
jgi:2-methylcitrate dehydratase PrpD